MSVALWKPPPAMLVKASFSLFTIGAMLIVTALSLKGLYKAQMPLLSDMGI